VIQIRDVKKNYDGHDVLDGVDISIPENSVYGIIGKSGAGKSTLVRIAGLLEKPDSGSVIYHEETVSDLSGVALLERRRKNGMIFQNFNLFSSRTAGENVAYPLEISRFPANGIKSRVGELLDLVGIADKRDSPISRLSGGQKQRVAIARALANSPDVLFCDEATSALDPQTTDSILSLIRELQRTMNLTVVMITHQMEVVSRICERVSVLDGGRIVEEGTVHEVFSRPKSPVTREFIAHLMPEELKELPTTTVAGTDKYRLRFTGAVTDQPILSRLLRTFPVEVNILAGTIHQLSGEHMGELVVELSGEEEARTKACAWLSIHGIEVEEYANE
jgi:D-methionine transport system ATP-binding protein